ncbi:MAG TPA: cell division protein ZapB [Rhodocyclaceae bacterium]|nr:cell division protein ZapB [Rhodocyclaceae bacterium]
MDKEISQLEERATRLLGEYQALRDENRALHTRLDALEADNTRLRDKLAQCIARVEALIARLPEREDA